MKEENKLVVELWQQSKDGDEEAFSRLFKIQYRVLFSYATFYTKDKDLIKDTIQNLFVYLWEKRQSIDVQFFSSYLIRSLRNNLIHELRKNGPFINTNTGMEEAGKIADGFIIESSLIENESSAEDEQKIRKAMSRLPKRQQEVLFLKFYQGLDNEKIAGIMEINRQSVANFLYKALSALKISIQNSSILLLAYLFDRVSTIFTY